MSQPTPNQLQDLIQSKKFEEGVTITGSTNTSIATGAVLFADTSSQLSHNANLFWEDTNEYLGVGTRSPAGKAHIDQDSDTGAIPVLYLDQADKSEEFIECAGSPNGNIMTQSLVAGASATTFTNAGWLRINVVSDNSAIMSSGAYYVALGTLT